MRFYELIFHNLAHRKLRSLLTAGGVAVAIATVVTLVGIAYGLTRSAVDAFRSHGVDLVVVRAGAVQRTASSMDESFAPRLASLPGVVDAIPALTDMVSLGGGGPVGVAVHGWPADSRVWNTLRLSRGRLLRTGDRHCVVLGEQLAKNLHKDVGDTVKIELQPFRVVGVYESSNVYESGAAAAPLKDLQELMDRAGQVSEFMLVLSSDLPDPETATAEVAPRDCRAARRRGKSGGTGRHADRTICERQHGTASGARYVLGHIVHRAVDRLGERSEHDVDVGDGAHAGNRSAASARLA